MIGGHHNMRNYIKGRMKTTGLFTLLEFCNGSLLMKLLRFFFNYEYMCAFAQIQCLEEAKDGVGYLGARITGSSELGTIKAGPLRETEVFLALFITEPSLQLHPSDTHSTCS